MVVTDLTEQKRNEEMLAEEKLTTQILHQAAEIFVLCDHQGRIIRASQSTNSLFGRSPIFQAFDEAFHLLYPDGTPFVLLSAMSDKLLHAVEVTFKHGDNESFSFLLRANSLITHKGVIGIVVVMVDITERKKIEEVLQKAHDELEQHVEERTLELRTALSEINTLKEQLEAENIYFRQEIKRDITLPKFSGKVIVSSMFSIERNKLLPRTQRSSSLVRPVRGRADRFRHP